MPAQTALLSQKSVNEFSKLHPGGPQVSLPALFGSSTGGDCRARRVSPLAGGAGSGMLRVFFGQKRLVPMAFFEIQRFRS